MKKLFNRLLSMAVASLVLCGAGCGVSSNDVNDIVDNVFANYESMNKTETSEYKNFKNINVESSYLGYGYDVINDPYMDKNAINFSAPILDMQKIENAQLKMAKENSSVVYESEGSTMQQFYEAYAASLNVYGKAGKMFSGGLKADFKGSDSEKSYWYFYKNIYNIKTFNLCMTDSVDKIRELLSDEFKNDLSNMKAEALFNKYGTHMIKEAAMGGRMEISSTYFSDTASSSVDMQAAVNAHIKFLGSASLNTEASASYESALETQDVKSKVRIKQFGGVLVDTHDLESLESNYSKWVESFDESLQNSALCGIVGENSLLGIWELLPESEQARATELKNKFIELSGDSYEQLCNQFKLKNSAAGGDEQEEVEDTSWTKITESLNEICLQDGGKYNPAEKNTDPSNAGHHEGWELAKLNFYGMEKNEDKFKIKNTISFSIKLQLLQDIERLPLDSGITEYRVSNDACNYVYGTNIAETVGKGAYWIRITYSDDTQTQIKQVNCLDGKVKGEYIELLSMEQVDFNKSLKQIEIVFVYELRHGTKTWYHCPDFRCDYVMNF